MPRALLSLAALLTAFLCATAIAHAEGIADRTLGHAGRWMTDPDGHVVILHGVNMPSKQLPAYPAALGFGEDDATLLNTLGFNAVRLTVERYALEPKPGHFDDGYLDQISKTVGLLATHGILSLIDFHQDEFGPTFYDNGYPDWMTQTDGLPNLYEVGFPAQYPANPALNRAFDHLWANDPDGGGRPLQSDDAEMLAHTAAFLRQTPGVLGYEIINEPWPGSTYPSCFNPAVGCPTFDQGQFSAYYGRTLPAIRSADQSRLIFYEPLVSFNYGIPTSVEPPADTRRGFAFHDYPACSATDDAGLPINLGSDCSTESELTLEHAVRRGSADGDALLETEFGATTNTSTVKTQLAAYDAHMLPWLWWSYTHYIVNLARDGKLLPATTSNVNQAMAATLARPYPELVAGTPVAWSFDASTRAFTARWSTRRADGHGRFRAGALSQIIVPALQYPKGYTVQVQGASVVSPPGAPVLTVAESRRAPQVQVTLVAS